MKKAYLLGLMALALGFTACDDIEDAPGKPQTNPQEQIVPADGFEVSTIDLGTTPLDLEKLMVADEPIAIGEVTAIPAEWNDEYTLIPRVYVSDTDKFEKVAIINGAYEEGKFLITPSQLEEALVAVYGLNPINRQPYIRTAMYGVKGNSEVRIGGTDVYFVEEQISADQAIKIWVDSEYYFVPVVNGVADKSAAIKMEHEGDNQYDYPTFTLRYNADSANQEWYIAPASTMNGEMDVWYGITPTTNSSGVKSYPLSGTLREGKVDAIDAGRFVAPSAYNVSINMVELSYKCSFAYESIYMATTKNAWTSRLVKTFELPRDDNYVHYRGFGVSSGLFRCISTPKYDATAAGFQNIGLIPTEGEEYIGTVAVDATDFLSGSGLYFVDVNLADLNYHAFAVTSVGMVGSFQGWNAAEPVEMTSKDSMIWTAEVTVPEGDMSWKVIFNKVWNYGAEKYDFSLGNSIDDLQYGSQNNLQFPGAGTYVVTLDLNGKPTMTCVAK